MAEDWLGKLSALKDSMPSVEEEPEEAVADNCDCREIEKARLDIVLDRKGRAGKSATIIAGFTVGDDAVAALASEMKRVLGTGGSSRGGEILIQGDRRKDVLAFLNKKGYKARVI